MSMQTTSGASRLARQAAVRHGSAPSPNVGSHDGAVESRGERLVRAARTERLDRRGRRARRYIWAALSVLLLALLIALIATNTHSVKLEWGAGATHASLAWVALVTTVLGWLLGIATSVLYLQRGRRPG
jgi:uncharacterized integral membrane protein